MLKRHRRTSFLQTLPMFQGLEFTKRAMASAAGAGHLDMVKWLHEKQAECTTDAMDMAAKEGHLEVVKVMIDSYMWRFGSGVFLDFKFQVRTEHHPLLICEFLR